VHISRIPDIILSNPVSLVAHLISFICVGYFVASVQECLI